MISQFKRAFIITGANKGLGKAFFDILFGKKQPADVIISISRRLSTEQAVAVKNEEDQFMYLPIDLALMHDTASLHRLKQYNKSLEQVVFINNAGVINPIGAVGNLDEEELQKSIKVNLLSPATIVNYILNIYEGKKIDILNISSGAANNIVEGWSAYCSAKSYMEVFMNSIKIENRNNSLINVHQVDPGLLDTDMQEEIRNAKKGAFLRQKDFINYKSEGKLQDPQLAALRILDQIKMTF